MGGSLGLLLANFTVFILLNQMSHEQMLKFGWRIPFLISTLVLVCLFFIRNKIDDARSNKGLMAEGLLSLITNYKRELLITFIVSSLSASAFYMTFIYMPTFLSSSVNVHSHQKSISITLVALLTYVLMLPLAGIVADKIGILKQIKIASFLYLLFSYICFTVLPGLTSMGCIVVLIFFAIIQATLNSALPAFMIAQFDSMQRGKALAISYNLSLTLFGGLMPYLILTNGMHINPGIPISICAALSLIVINYVRKK